MKNEHDPATCLRSKAIEQIVVKTCGCGRKFSTAEWRQLPHAYTQDDGVERVEYRNCPCGSTIGVRQARAREVVEATQ